MSDEEKVREIFPDATVYGYGHGKVRIETPELILSEMMYLGTREKRRADAWADAARKLEGV